MRLLTAAWATFLKSASVGTVAEVTGAGAICCCCSGVLDVASFMAGGLGLAMTVTAAGVTTGGSGPTPTVKGLTGAIFLIGCGFVVMGAEDIVRGIGAPFRGLGVSLLLFLVMTPFGVPGTADFFLVVVIPVFRPVLVLRRFAAGGPTELAFLLVEVVAVGGAREVGAGAILTDETTGASGNEEGVVPGALAVEVLALAVIDGCSRVVRSLKEVEGRKAPNPSSTTDAESET
jgi:hypothetical protein